MTIAEFGGSKAWSIQSSPLIYHLLLRGTVNSFAEDRVKAWCVGAGAAELKVNFSFCNAGVNIADGESREGRTFSSILLSSLTHPPRCPGIRETIHCDHEMKGGLQHCCSCDQKPGTAKDPWIPQLCSGRKPHSLPQCFSTLQEFCTNHRNQRGESFIQTPPSTAAFYLAVFEECMEAHGRSSSRWARDCQTRQLLHKTLTVSLWKHPKTPHSSSLLSP